jgi:hypothetical protein
MQDPATFRSDLHPSSPRRGARSPRPFELFRLRGATDVVRGLAIETSYGFAFGLELDRELVLLLLQRDIESMVTYADRLEVALIAQGWTVVDAPFHGRSGYAH